MTDALVVAMLISGSLSLFIAILFLTLYATIRSLEAEGHLGHYAIFAVLAALNAVFLFSFAALLRAGADLELRNVVNRLTIASASFLVPIAVHFYKIYFIQPGRRLLRLFYGLSALFALACVPSHPAFLLKQHFPTSAYYSGLAFGWGFRLWGGYILVLSIYALAVLARTYQRITRDRLPERRALVALLGTNMAWMVTGIIDALTGIRLVDMPPLTWIGSLLVVLAISWILIAHIHTLYSERNRFYKELIRDHLTGAYSRGYADIQLQSALEGLHRRETPFCLAICDIDNFKLVNDRRGHLSGDGVLRGVAAAMQQHLRPSDVLARYGGDEFAVILGNLASPAAVQAVLQRLQESIRGLDFAGAPASFRVTCSFGACRVTATTVPEDLRAEDLFARADEALYRSKQEGRDRVTVLDLAANAPTTPLPRFDARGRNPAS